MVRVGLSLNDRIASPQVTEIVCLVIPHSVLVGREARVSLLALRNLPWLIGNLDPKHPCRRTGHHFAIGVQHRPNRTRLPFLISSSKRLQTRVYCGRMGIRR
jgi:hypothetical protein